MEVRQKPETAELNLAAEMKLRELEGSFSSSHNLEKRKLAVATVERELQEHAERERKIAEEKEIQRQRKLAEAKAKEAEEARRIAFEREKAARADMERKLREEQAMLVKLAFFAFLLV